MVKFRNDGSKLFFSLGNRKSSFDTDDQGSIDARDAMMKQDEHNSSFDNDKMSFDNNTAVSADSYTADTNPFRTVGSAGVVLEGDGHSDIEIRKISNDSSFRDGGNNAENIIKDIFFTNTID